MNSVAKLKALVSGSRSIMSSSSSCSASSSSSKFPQFIPLPVQSAESAIRFGVVSFNILAQVYVKSSYFPHSPSPCLKWKARSGALLSLLTHLCSNAHILCLQEVDEFSSFYKPNLETLGYSALYIQRNGQKRDGCAVFYRRQFAELVLQEDIHYNDLVQTLTQTQTETQTQTPDPEGAPRDDPGVRLKRDCVGIMAAFKLKGFSNHIVIVANTHLYWDPEWADVKLAQAKYLLSRLAQFRALVNHTFNSSSSIIVAGDFNSTPGDEVYQYLVSEENVPFRLCSVYGSTKGEPKFTNCTPDFTDTLDYILFSPSGSIEPVSLLDLPGSGSIDVVDGLPNYTHPSDHLPIGAEFKISGSV